MEWFFIGPVSYTHLDVYKRQALDQSVGSVGAEELDICYYKAKAQYLSGDVDLSLIHI